MSRGSGLGRLHGAALRVQVSVVLAAIPVAALLHGMAVSPIVLDVAMADASPAARDAARAAVTVIVAVVVLGVLLATLGASLLLRGSVRAVVEELEAATSAIARGDFAHRVRSERGDELGRLARAIDTMAGRLERLEHARRRTLACVSHELRTPLTIIRGHAFSLARRERDHVRRDRLRLVEAEAGRLGDLIEDLVDAACLQAGSVRLHVERVDIASVVRATAARFGEEAAHRELRVRVHGCEQVVEADVDAARIDQLLANLLANAVRHAWPGTDIDVTVARVRGGVRTIRVANRGPAIDAVLEPSLFEPFVQGEARAGRVGLGLAIAHGLAAAHGGSLGLASSGRASGVVEFELVLPAPARRGAAVEVEARPRRDLPVAGLRLVET